MEKNQTKNPTVLEVKEKLGNRVIEGPGFKVWATPTGIGGVVRAGNLQKRRKP